MSAIAQLKALLGIDTGQYKAGVKDAEGATKKFQSTLASIGRMLGVAFSVGTVIQFGRSLVSWASNASEAAQNAGVLTSEMIAMNRVGIQAGLQVGDMGALLEKLQNRLYEAAKGNKDATDSFAQIGLSVADLAGMDPAAMLEAVAKAAADSNIPLQTLSDIFGEKLGTKAMTALMDIAENGLPDVDAALGDTADQVEMLTDRWAEMGDTAKSNLMQSASWLEKVIGRAAAFYGGLFTFGPEAQGKTGGQMAKDYMAALDEYNADALAKRQRKREDRRAAAASAAKGVASLTDAERVGDWSKRDLEARRKIRQEFETAISRLRGRTGSARGGFAGVQVDEMSRMGGHIGNSRVNLNVADRGIVIAKETKEIQADIRNLTRQMNDRLAAIDETMSGGAL